MDAIREEARQRSLAMLEGLQNYQAIELEIEETPYEVVWQKGAARLLDYGSAARNAPAVLCIPSLINRYYILDLYPDHSLIEYLLDRGFHPLVLDWGEPTRTETSYDCADYLRQVAAPSLRFARQEYGRPVHLMGYCMGGVFATALATQDPEAVQSLSLLATPWDFSSHHLAADQAAMEAYGRTLLDQEVVPSWWVQSLFHLANPWHFQEKFGRFNQMSGAEQQHFVAVEAWVNDGVPLARKVAKECLVDWPVHNPLQRQTWQVDGEAVCPEDVVCPCFIAIPTEDKIVPPACALPLAEQLSDATLIRPKTGHVSMVVGKHAKRDLWQPWVKWLKRQG